MTCIKIKEKMWDCLLQNNFSQEFAEHFVSCSDCSVKFEQIKQIIQTIKPKIKVRASDNFTFNTIKKIEVQKN